jgi:hypothetical protein
VVDVVLIQKIDDHYYIRQELQIFCFRKFYLFSFNEKLAEITHAEEILDNALVA